MPAVAGGRCLTPAGGPPQPAAPATPRALPSRRPTRQVRPKEVAVKFAVLSPAEVGDLSGLLYAALRPAGGGASGGRAARPARTRALLVGPRAAQRAGRAKELVALRRAG